PEKRPFFASPPYMGFRRSLVRIQSPRHEGRLSADDSRPFLLTALAVTAKVSESSSVFKRTMIDGGCPELSAVGASVGASCLYPEFRRPSVPVALRASPSAWSPCKGSAGRASRAPRTS